MVGGCWSGRHYRAFAQRPPHPHPETSAGKGGSSGGVRGKFLSGPFPSGVNGWHVRGLETEEDTLTAVRGGGYSGLLRGL